MTDPAIRFVQVHPRDVHESVLARWLPDLLPSTTRQLMMCERIATRLADLFRRDHPFPPCPMAALDSPSVTLALLPPESLADAALHVAAVRYAGLLVRVVRREDRAVLSEGLGEPVLRFARANADLACPNIQAVPLPELIGAVHESAPECLAHWLDDLPDGVRQRAAVRIGPVVRPSADSRWPGLPGAFERYARHLVALPAQAAA